LDLDLQCVGVGAEVLDVSLVEGEPRAGNDVATRTRRESSPKRAERYTPTTGYSGPDSFTYSATDPLTNEVSNTATVTLDV
jgi:hypothetical protein